MFSHHHLVCRVCLSSSLSFSSLLYIYLPSSRPPCLFLRALRTTAPTLARHRLVTCKGKFVGRETADSRLVDQRQRHMPRRCKWGRLVVVRLFGSVFYLRPGVSVSKGRPGRLLRVLPAEVNHGRGTPLISD